MCILFTFGHGNALGQLSVVDASSRYVIEFNGTFTGIGGSFPCAQSLVIEQNPQMLADPVEWCCSFDTTPAGPSVFRGAYAGTASLSTSQTAAVWDSGTGSLIPALCNGLSGTWSTGSVLFTGETEIVVTISEFGQLAFSASISTALQETTTLGIGGAPSLFNPAPDGQFRCMPPGSYTLSADFIRTDAESPQLLRSGIGLEVRFQECDSLPANVDINADNNFTEIDLCDWLASPSDVDGDGTADQKDYDALRDLLAFIGATLTDADFDGVPDQCDPFICAADIDGDLDADPDDIAAFVDAFVDADPVNADIDGDGDEDPDDIATFVTAFVGGCA